MNERKTIHRIFWVWEFEKEERWLNEMTLEGWALDKAAFCSYRFMRCEPGEYIIRMEMSKSTEYRNFVEGLGQNMSAAASTGSISAARQNWETLTCSRTSTPALASWTALARCCGCSAWPTCSSESPI